MSKDIVIVILSLLLYHCFPRTLQQLSSRMLRRTMALPCSTSQWGQYEKSCLYPFCQDGENDTIHPISCRRYQEDCCLYDVFKTHPFITYVLCCRLHRVNVRLGDDHARTKGVHRNAELLAFPGEGSCQSINTGFRTII